MKKMLMALVAVATLAVSTATPALAWRGGWGPGIGLGLLGGAIVGGAIANSYYPYGGYYGPGYGYYGPGYAGGPYGPCYWQRQRFWDGYGWQVRNVRVCGLWSGFDVRQFLPRFLMRTSNPKLHYQF
jgi:hypothetical protein